MSEEEIIKEFESVLKHYVHLGENVPHDVALADDIESLRQLLSSYRKTVVREVIEDIPEDIFITTGYVGKEFDAKPIKESLRQLLTSKYLEGDK